MARHCTGAGMEGDFAVPGVLARERCKACSLGGWSHRMSNCNVRSSGVEQRPGCLLSAVGEYADDSSSHRLSPTRRALGIMLVVGGMTAITLAVVGLRAVGDAPVNSPEVAVDAMASSDGGPASVDPADVTVVSMSYEPGETSGWHVHHGMHAVAVVSGTLTLYDGACRARSLGPGDSYVGGRELHLARNETATPVGMVVTYLGAERAGVAPFNVSMQAPAGCTVQR